MLKERKRYQEIWSFVRKIPSRGHKVSVVSSLVLQRVSVNWFFYVGSRWYSSSENVTAAGVIVVDFEGLQKIVSVRLVVVFGIIDV